MTTHRSRSAGAAHGPTPLGLKALAERTARLAARRAPAPGPPTAVMMIWEADGGLFGLPLEAVSRVRPYRRAGRGPGATHSLVDLAVEAGSIRPILELAGGQTLGPATAEGGYLMTLARHGAAVRAEALPEAATVELLDTPDGPRGRVLDGAYRNRIIVRLSADELAGADAPTRQEEAERP